MILPNVKGLIESEAISGNLWLDNERRTTQRNELLSFASPLNALDADALECVSGRTPFLGPRHLAGYCELVLAQFHVAVIAT